MKKILEKIEEKLPGSVFLLPTEAENWEGDCLFVFVSAPVESVALTSAYIGDDKIFFKTNSNKELTVYLDEVEIFELPLGSYKVRKLAKKLAEIVDGGNKEINNLVNEIINKMIEEQKKKISVLQEEIARLESLLS